MPSTLFGSSVCLLGTGGALSWLISGLLSLSALPGIVRRYHNLVLRTCSLRAGDDTACDSFKKKGYNRQTKAACAMFFGGNASLYLGCAFLLLLSPLFLHELRRYQAISTAKSRNRKHAHHLSATPKRRAWSAVDNGDGPCETVLEIYQLGLVPQEKVKISDEV